MKYEQLVGFKSTLAEKYADVDTDLPLPDEHIAKIATMLQDDQYTYLSIADGTNYELVKISKVLGKLVVERGVSNTTAHNFPKGSCVKWLLTADAVKDIICQMPCCPEE